VATNAVVDPGFEGKSFKVLGADSYHIQPPSFWYAVDLFRVVGTLNLAVCVQRDNNMQYSDFFILSSDLKMQFYIYLETTHPVEIPLGSK